MGREKSVTISAQAAIVAFFGALLWSFFDDGAFRCDMNFTVTMMLASGFGSAIMAIEEFSGENLGDTPIFGAAMCTVVGTTIFFLIASAGWGTGGFLSHVYSRLPADRHCPIKIDRFALDELLEAAKQSQ